MGCNKLRCAPDLNDVNAVLENGRLGRTVVINHPKARGRGGPVAHREVMLETLMRRTLTILCALVAVLFEVVLVGVLLPAVNKVEDLGASGAGLELGEWQVSVGGCLLASVLFAILALASGKTTFGTGLLVVSWLAFLGCGATAVCLYSIKTQTGMVNQYGHGLRYGEWWASVIPWTIATALVAVSAVAALVRALRKRAGA